MDADNAGWHESAFYLVLDWRLGNWVVDNAGQYGAYATNTRLGDCTQRERNNGGGDKSFDMPVPTESVAEAGIRNWLMSV